MGFTNEYTLLRDKSNVFKSINYDKVMKMLNHFKTGVIFVGGPWCKNCQAVVGIVNKVAKDNKLKTIYHYDPHFINVFKEEVDLRDCKDLETKLKYYEFIEKIEFKSDKYVIDTLIPRLNVPAIIGIKNGICVGVIDEEYIYDAAGLHVEENLEDKTVEYSNKLTELFKKVKEKNKL